METLLLMGGAGLETLSGEVTVKEIAAAILFCDNI